MPFVVFIFSKLAKAQPDVVRLFWGHYPSFLGLIFRRLTPLALEFWRRGYKWAVRPFAPEGLR